MSLSFKPHPRVMTDAERAEIHMKAAKEKWGDCHRCPLHKRRYSRNVGQLPLMWGSGSAGAAVMVIDANTNWDEISTRVKYGGKTIGLMYQVWTALGIRPSEDLFCTNLLKCPRVYDKAAGGNQDPDPEWVETCKKVLMRQIQIVRPALLIVQGKAACHAVLGDTRSSGQYMGHVRTFGKTCVALSTHSPFGFFGDREHLKIEYFEHWKQGLYRLNMLGRIWRPEAAIFKRGWKLHDPGAAA